MKLYLNGEIALRYMEPHRVQVGAWSETDRLTDVLLCAPSHLQPVPCCSVTRESIRKGFTTSTATALQQHRDLCDLLLSNGVQCHFVPPAPDMPDLCFTRDVAAATPWGLVALNPAMAHRQQEVERVLAFAGGSAPAVSRISQGHIEGGDICVARSGLLIVGVSGERTDQAGADAFAQPFHHAGWDVLFCPFDPHFLHLDTVFCMIGPRLALACADVLDDGFLAALARRGIEVLPVTYKESRKLGCNILSLDGRSVVANAATPRVSRMMRDAGVIVHEIEIGELSACGGGVHCLTMPLRRERLAIAQAGAVGAELEQA
jgi:N-dimethylarginine dimethylaminohydrolase